jgi:O-antigen/teichoic acid export membrane protein/glycosyltransferase involved in cell wall biosynthesis
VKQFKIAVIPRDRNPYQESLYGPMRAAGFEVRYAAELTRSRTLNLLLLPLEIVWLRLRGFRIIHIHWVFGFRFPWRPASRRVGRLSRMWFDLMLRWASLVGLRVVWTAHNTLPHAPVFDDDVIGRRSLVTHSALVIAHTPHALSELAQFSPTHTTVIPHGPSGPEELRTLAPPAAEPARRVLFLGRIAPYKGIDDLLAAMRMVTADLQLVIAGTCEDVEVRRRLDAAVAGDPRIQLRLEHVPDADLPSLLSTADALVFPFRTITTSGSLLLGMASGRTAIVPDLPALRDLPSDAVISYAPGPEGLAAALTRVTTLPSTELVRKGLAARAAADPATWPELAQRTLTAFDEVLDTPSQFGSARANHLLTGSATLLVNTMLLAIGGFVFWAVAARTYTSSSVGVYSGINSLSTLLGSVAALGCPLAIIRFLPGEPQKRRLVVAMIGTVLVLGTCVVALVELIAGPLLFPSVHLPHDLHTAVLTLALVVVASVGAVTDAALITDRATMTVLIKNLIGSVVKVVVLLPLAGLGTTGLITAATIGGVVAALLGAGALWRRLPATSGPWRELERAVEYVRYSLTGYASVLIGILPLTVVPLIVLGVLGKAQAGWFSIAFLISALLSFVPATAAQVLFAEGSRDARALRANAITALKAIYALLLPGAVVLGVCAPWILGLLGHGYEAHAGNALRALAGGSVFLGFTYVIDSILTAMDRMKSFFAINVINSVLVVGLVAHFAHSGLTAVALSWDLAQALSVLFGLAILFGPRLRRAGRSPASRPTPSCGR